MKNIRVGFMISGNNEWIGGLNYLKNLVAAVMLLPERRIEPVLIVAPGTPKEHLAGLEALECVSLPARKPNLPYRVARKAASKLLGQNLAMQSILRQHRIDVLSHSGHLEARSRIPTIGWIPDFQHVRLPQFFKPEEIAYRNKQLGKTANWCTTVILSSKDAQSDFARFAPAAKDKSRVLRFVAGMVQFEDALPADLLEAEYGIREPYFYLPNQFWKHKNHALVVDALARLAQAGRAPLVVCTGHTNDRRNPAYFPDLMARVQGTAVEPHFKVLGLVPYGHLSRLMRSAIAIINPSLFEGWSTTVEEAKSLGKPVILSDITVHREQAPRGGIYVGTEDAQAMADAMVTMQARQSRDADAEAMRIARVELPERLRAFAEIYQEIVVDTVERFGR